MPPDSAWRGILRPSLFLPAPLKASIGRHTAMEVMSAAPAQCVFFPQESHTKITFLHGPDVFL